MTATLSWNQLRTVVLAEEIDEPTTKKIPECGAKETLACENIRFSSLFVAGDVSCGSSAVPLRETSPAAKSGEKRMFSQAKETQLSLILVIIASCLIFPINICEFFLYEKLIEMRGDYVLICKGDK